MRSIKNLPLIVLLIVAIIGSMVVLPACSDDDDDEDGNGAATTSTSGSSKASYRLKLAHSMPEGSFEGDIVDKFVQLLNEYTDGRVEVDIYPNSMLYNSQEVLAAGQSGAVDIVFDMMYFFYNRFPYLMFSNLNGFWDGPEHCQAFDTHPDVIAKMSADCDKLDLHFLGIPYMNSALIHFSKNKEMKTLKDMDGMTMGTVMGTALSNAGEWSGVRPVQVDVTEIYSGFQMGMFDLICTTFTTALSNSVWDMGAKHAFIQPKSSNTVLLAALNKGTWEDFPADIQDIITNQVMPDFNTWLSAERAKVYDDILAELKTLFETVNIQPDEITAQMYAATMDNSMTKMFIKQAGELYDLADSLRP